LNLSNNCITALPAVQEVYKEHPWSLNEQTLQFDLSCLPSLGNPTTEDKNEFGGLTLTNNYLPSSSINDSFKVINPSSELGTTMNMLYPNVTNINELVCQNS